MLSSTFFRTIPIKHQELNMYNIIGNFYAKELVVYIGKRVCTKSKA